MKSYKEETKSILIDWFKKECSKFNDLSFEYEYSESDRYYIVLFYKENKEDSFYRDVSEFVAVCDTKFGYYSPSIYNGKRSKRKLSNNKVIFNYDSIQTENDSIKTP